MHISRNYSITITRRLLLRQIKLSAISLLVVSAFGCSDVLAPGDDSLNGSSPDPTPPASLSALERIESETFQIAMFPTLRTNCATCHGGGGPGSPDIAAVNPVDAWSEVKDHDTVDFVTPFRFLAGPPPL